MAWLISMQRKTNKDFQQPKGWTVITMGIECIIGEALAGRKLGLLLSTTCLCYTHLPCRLLWRKAQGPGAANCTEGTPYASNSSSASAALLEGGPRGGCVSRTGWSTLPPGVQEGTANKRLEQR
jgi:hypothetical protein